MLRGLVGAFGSSPFELQHIPTSHDDGKQKRTVPWEPLRPGALSQPLSGQSCWQWPTAGIAHVRAHPWRGGRGVRVVGGHRTRFTGP